MKMTSLAVGDVVFACVLPRKSLAGNGTVRRNVAIPDTDTATGFTAAAKNTQAISQSSSLETKLLHVCVTV